MIDYRYKTFSILAETLNYTKTAKILNMSQPAVTKHIQYLEYHLEAQLVYYENRKLTLTEKGHYLKKEIDKVIQDTEIMKNILSEEISQKSLIVGASRTIGEYFITDKLQQFSLNEEDAEIDLIIDNTRNLLKLLEQGELDVALISGPFDRSLYETRAFFEDSIVAVCSPDNPIVEAEDISFSELGTERLLLRENGSGIYDALDEALSESGLSLNQFSTRTTIGNIYLIKELVKKDEGISFLYYVSVADEILEKSLYHIPISDFSFSQPFYLVFSKTDRPNKLREKFVRLFKEEIKIKAKQDKK